MVETNLTRRKLPMTTIRPIKPFRSLVEAAEAFLGSPVENIKLQPAMIMFAKKTTPAKKIRRFMIEYPAPVPPLLVRRSARVPSGFMLVAGFWLFMLSITDIFLKSWYS